MKIENSNKLNLQKISLHKEKKKAYDTDRTSCSFAYKFTRELSFYRLGSEPHPKQKPLKDSLKYGPSNQLYKFPCCAILDRLNFLC